MKLLRAFLTDTTAMNSIQYAFIAAGIAGTIIFGVNATSVSFPNIWTTVATALRQGRPGWRLLSFCVQEPAKSNRMSGPFETRGSPICNSRMADVH